MQVNLSPELQARVDRMAAEQGRDAASLMLEAVERIVRYDQWFLEQVEEGLAQIERGEVLEHDEVGERIEKLLSEKQRAPDALALEHRCRTGPREHHQLSL
jgi:predicted transcriptional regulator